MRQLLYIILTVIISIFFTTCEEREITNPFDPNCPKEIFTPTNFNAVQNGNFVRLTWEQSNNQISGFRVERKVDAGSWSILSNPSKSATNFDDSSLTGGKIHYYKITAEAGGNLSNYIETSILVRINPTGFFVDSRDGNTYKWVKIGNQTWMAENLAFLPNISLPSESSLTEARFYVYDFNQSNIADAKSSINYKNHGVLYNWIAASESCPSGWHLPDEDEWTTLKDYLIDNSYNYDGTITGNKIGKSIASQTMWTSNPDVGNVGNNIINNNLSGFSGLPSGSYNSNDNSYYSIGGVGIWWSSSRSSTNAYSWALIHRFPNLFQFSSDKKSYGLSVRCIKD